MLLALVSAIFMASSGDCTANVDSSTGAATVSTFTYSHFSGFKLFVGCNITAFILEFVLLCLQLQAWIRRTVEDGIVLVVVEYLVLALLYPATTVAIVVAAFYSDQTRGCAAFTEQVKQAKIVSIVACIAVILANITNRLKFKVPGLG
jgi:hypothetical protein